jgi:cob(I)alamin adenosyltransferase
MAIRIYTRTGDKGETGLFGGQRVRKDDERVESYGAVDELNASLGICRSMVAEADLADLLDTVQRTLFDIGADLATPESAGDTRGSVVISRLSPDAVSLLELHLDQLECELAPLRRFILPGGSSLAANLHFARCICRRAERRCVSLAAAENINPEVIRYLNRLSDLLFVMARVVNSRAGIADTTWES